MKPIIDLMKQIVAKKAPHYSVWTGDETAVMAVYQDKLISLGYLYTPCDTVVEATQMANRRTLDKSKRCFVVTQDGDYLKEEKNWQKVTDTFNSCEHILVLKYPILDKRSKFYKSQDKWLTTFEKMADDVLLKHIAKELPHLSEPRQEELLKICESDYNRILLEADKIRRYNSATNTNTDTVFDILVKDGTIHQSLSDVTFKFTDAVAYGAIDDVAKYLTIIQAKQENPLGLLSILYGQFRTLLMVQGLGKDRSNASARTGLTGWQVKQAVDKLGGYSNSELLRAMRVIQKAESGIKTGNMPTEIALEYAVINIMKG